MKSFRSSNFSDLFNWLKWPGIALVFLALQLQSQTRPPLIEVGQFQPGGSPVALLSSDLNKDGTSELLAVRYQASDLFSVQPNTEGALGGFRVTYFDNKDLNGKRITRTESQIKHNWGNSGPVKGWEPETFSARWTTHLKITRGGTYRFWTRSDDGIRLRVNGKLIIDRWHNMGPTFHHGEIKLSGPGNYNLSMEYYENYGGAVAELHWQPPGYNQRQLLTAVGGLGAGPTYPLPLASISAISVDLNRDSQNDLISLQSGLDESISILMNQNGQLLSGKQLSTGSDPGALLAGDLNKDGYPDIISMNRGDPSISIFWNREGTLDQAQSLPCSRQPRAMQLADLDNDKDLDILLLDQTGKYLSFFINKGGQKFEPHSRELQLSKTATDIRAMDINKDRRLELISVHSKGSVVYRVQKNLELQQLSAISQGGSLAIGDLNRDGLAEIILVGDERLYIYTGNRSAKFTSVRSMPVQGKATQALLLDFNGDRKLELATLDEENGLIRLYKSR